MASRSIFVKFQVIRRLLARVGQGFPGVGNPMRSLFSRQSFWLPVVLFVGLFVAALALLVWLSLSYEKTRRQAQLDNDVSDAAAAIQAVLLRDLQSFQLQGLGVAGAVDFARAARRVLVGRPEILLIERRPAVEQRAEPAAEPVTVLSSFAPATVLALSRLERLSPEAAISRDLVNLHGGAGFSGSYFVAMPPSDGVEVMELWAAENGSDKPAPLLRVVYSLSELLAQRVPESLVRRNEIMLLEPDNTLLARLKTDVRGASVYSAKARIDLPSQALVLRVNSADSSPELIPNLASGLVVMLGSGFMVSLLFLIRDAQRRNRAEASLRSQNQLRKAMEDSLVTGLRARDMDGRVSYVNPAFCEMVGYTAVELIGQLPPMPYWAPEVRHEYERRFSQVLAGTVTRQGYETVFMRPNGERFPVLIYESALVGDRGEQTGWMASIVDLSEQRRIEDINRQQQEKLQNTARLATLGEIATVLSHELNQPLAAISTYAAAARTVAAGSAASTDDDLMRSLSQIEKQALRAGTIVHRVHEFMRRRQVTNESLDLLKLLREVMPLIELQARRFWVSPIITSVLSEAPVRAERVMLEQVVLNLTRNGIEAMANAEQEKRVLEIEVSAGTTPQGRALIQVSILDWGTGVPASVGANLFEMFASTKKEGMGIGLNISRSVIEASGGRLWHEPRLQDGRTVGAKFCFELPKDVGE
jgi:two-component system, LuxR family, sensor histidine kinase DctS